MIRAVGRPLGVGNKEDLLGNVASIGGAVA